MSESSIWKNEEEIFDLARRIDDPEVRASYLQQACQGSDALVARVQELLSINSKDDSLLDRSPAGSQPTISISQEPIESEGQTIGPYELLQQLGEGGFGVVFMAEQLEPVRRKVALKIIKPGMESSDVVARFEAERQALALMNHPNIASVFDGGCTPSGRPYFVMELVRGVSITEYCDKRNLSPQERIELFRDVCSAIQHAHQKGIIHRDLKPSNVMVTLHDGKPVVKVIDFGVAKAINQQLTDKMYFTRYGQMIGTPQYMSPEQAEMSGLGIDTLSDIYSLGVLLYELLVGTTPLSPQDLREAGFQEMRRLICDVAPALPSKRLSTTGQQELADIANRRSVSPEKLTEELQGDLEWIVMKTLEKERDRRYATPLDLSRDLQRYLACEAIEARPPSLGYRLVKYAQRNRSAVAASFGIASAVLFAAIFSSLMWWRARQESDRTKVALASESAARAEAEAIGDELRRTVEVVSQQNASLEKQAYRTSIQEASAAVSAFNLAKARSILEECPRRFRDWEWQRLMCQAGDRTIRVRGNHVPMFSEEDGILMTVGKVSGAIDFWDMSNGEQTDQIPIDSESELVMNAISPDKSTVAVADAAGVVHLVDLSSRTIRLFHTQHSGRIDGLSFSSDGERLFTAAWDGVIRLWDVATGKIICEQSVNSRLRCVAVDPTGNLVATASSASIDKSQMLLRIWRADDLKPLEQVPIEQFSAGSVDFSPTGDRIVAGAKGQVRVWSTSDWSEIDHYEGNFPNLQSVSFSPDAGHILIGSRGGLAEWDLESGKLVELVGELQSPIYWTRYSEDGASVAYYTGDRISLQERKGQRPQWFPVPLRAMTESWICCGEFNSDSTSLAVGDVNGSIMILDSKTRKVVREMTEHKAPVWGLTWDSENRLYSLDRNGILIAWTEDGDREWSKDFGSYDAVSSFHALASIPGRNEIAIGTEGQGLLLISAVDGRVQRRIETEGAVRAVACAPDGSSLAWWDNGRRVHVYDLVLNSVVQSFPSLNVTIREIAFSPDSRSVAGVGSRFCWVFDLDTEKMRWHRSNKVSCYGIGFSKSGDRVFISGDTKYGYSLIRDASDGFLLEQIPTKNCFDFAQKADDESLVFYGKAGTVKLYPVSKTTQ